MNKKLEAEFIKWAEARDDDWWEKGEGHISIWDVRVILEFFRSQQLELLEKVKEILVKIYTDETDEGYLEDVELNKAHNGSIDIAMTRISELEKEI